ncbi:vWA domain-containing protein [Vibrio sp. SCSIO 43137]|uniref:vWA domain-containing protein n=1 Tax=Vibrio sp. SCSIO 43137 TaxID=3021011 RepID=UPI00230825CE|nr:vWA domain-containing protein [Vibrio sp. SCSIO 43137]WCE28878.1 VWA domain-containing protein [Vibrio sp. SCSIO 43137]
MSAIYYSSPRHKESGLVELVTIIAIPFLLLLTGFAFDVGRAYLVKAKLFAAVDAAAIAAARGIEEGQDAANADALAYFRANIPADYFNSNPTLTLPDSYPSDAAGNISIDLSATAVMPTVLLHMFGFDSIPLSAVAQATRRPVDIAFVVDNSSSLQTGSLGDVTGDVKQRSKEFISKFHENFDRVSLVAYGHGAETSAEIGVSRGFNRNTLNSAIDSFEFDGFTNPSEGFYRALKQLRETSNPADLRVIVFFTDGAPNTFSAKFRYVNGNTYSGSIRASSSTSGTPSGLYRHDKIYQTAPGLAWRSNGINNNLTELPEYYNMHASGYSSDAEGYVPRYIDNPSVDPNYPSADSDKLLVVNSTISDGPYDPVLGHRPVTQFNRFTDSRYDLFDKVSRISRNLAEEMAEVARKEGIYVFTLGLGSRLQEASGPDSEYGEDMLKRMANDVILLKDANLASDYKADQLQGVYCHAVDADALAPCFGEMLEVIIKLTL